MEHLGVVPGNNPAVLSGGKESVTVSRHFVGFRADRAKRFLLIIPILLLTLFVPREILASDTHSADNESAPRLISTKSLSHHQHRRALPSSAPKHANSINYLVYGSAGEPLQIIEPDGLLSGFVTDVVNEIFSDADWHIQPVMKPIKRIKREMVQGKAKRWIAYALRSWKSEGVWGNTSFAEVDLLSYHLSLGYKKTSVQMSLSEISEEGIVWIQGFRYPGALEFSGRYNFRFQRAKNHTAMLKMVEAGRVYAFMEYAPRMEYVMNKLDVNADDYEFYSLADEIPPTTITLLMSNDLGVDVIEFINRRLKMLERSGRIRELALRYGLVS